MRSFEATFQEARALGGFEKAFSRWRRKRASIRKFGSLDELISLCQTREETAKGAKELALTALCSLARKNDSEASHFLIWLFIPLFRRIRKDVGECQLTEEDLEAEILGGFWEGVSKPGHPAGITSRLFHAVQHRAWVAVAAASRVWPVMPTQPLEEPLPAIDPPFTGILEDAAHEAGLLPEEMALILSTRLEGRDLRDIAREMGLSHATVGMRRVRAEKKLVRWLEEQPNLIRKPSNV